MQKFDYRAPRFLVDFPVQLTVGDSTQLGRCKEISVDGMRLELCEVVAANSLGTLRMNYESLRIELDARVTHTVSSSVGLKFVFESDRQRKDIERLVTLLAASATLQPPTILG
jgi:hypothetical protein